MEEELDFKMMNKDFTAGVFFGGILAMILMAVLSIWDHMELAPMIFILLLDAYLLVEIIIEKTLNKYKPKKKKKK